MKLRNVSATQWIIIASGLVLYGCGGDPSPTSLDRPLADVELADPVLQACLNASAAQMDYQTVADVREISCACAARCQQDFIDARAAAGTAEDMPKLITSTEGIEQFTQLRTLDLGMNLLARIDVSDLLHLQHLNLAGALITELDLSRNSALRSLDVRATRLTDLDLRGLNKLEQVRATPLYSDDSIYLTDFLEVAWPLADMSPGEFAAHRLQSLIVDADAPLVALHLAARTEHNVQASASLLAYTGPVSPAMLHNSPNLVAVTGELTGPVTELDLSSHTALLYLHLSSASLTGFTPPVGLEQLILEAPLTSLEPGDNTELVSLFLASPMEINPYLAVGYEGAFSGSLRHLTLKNYNLGREFDVGAYTVMETLTLDHSYVDIALTIPDTLRDLTVRGITEFSLSSAAVLERLTFESVPVNVCDMGDVSVPNTRNLSIHDCAAATVELGNYAKLENLHITDSALNVIDLSPLVAVQSVVLTDNRLTAVDLSSFTGQQKTLLDLRGNELDEAYKQDLQSFAETIFERVDL